MRSAPALCGVVVNCSCTCRCLKVCSLCAVTVAEDNVYEILRNVVVVKTCCFVIVHLSTGPSNVGICIPSIAVNLCPLSCVFNVNSYEFCCSITSFALACCVVAVAKSVKIFRVRILALRASPCSCTTCKASNCSCCNLICVVARRSFNSSCYLCALKSDSYCTTVFSNCELVVCRTVTVGCSPRVVLSALKLISTCFNVCVDFNI